MSKKDDLKEILSEMGITNLDVIKYMNAREFFDHHKKPTEKLNLVSQIVESLEWFKKQDEYTIEIEYSFLNATVMLKTKYAFLFNKQLSQTITNAMNLSDVVCFENDLGVEDENALEILFQVHDVFMIPEKPDL